MEEATRKNGKNYYKKWWKLPERTLKNTRKYGRNY